MNSCRILLEEHSVGAAVRVVDRGDVGPEDGPLVPDAVALAPPPEPHATTAVTAVSLPPVRPSATITAAAAAAKATAATKTVTTQMTIVTGQCSTRRYMMVTLVT